MDEDRKEQSAAESTQDGCAVDWSWLRGREIASATSTLEKLIISFCDGETLTVHASNWKGKPFLAFTPWRAKVQP